MLSRRETVAALVVSILPGESLAAQTRAVPGVSIETLERDLDAALRRLRVADTDKVIRRVHAELTKEDSDVLDPGAVEEVVRGYLERQSLALHRRLDEKMLERLDPHQLLDELARSALPTPMDDAARIEWSDRLRWLRFSRSRAVLKVRREVRERFVRFVEERIASLQRLGIVRVDVDPHDMAAESIRRVDGEAARLLANPSEAARAAALRRMRSFFERFETPVSPAQPKRNGRQ